MSNEKITSENLEELFDEGCDVTGFFDFDSAVVVEGRTETKRVNVDMPIWMVEALDKEAKRVGIGRQAVIKMWLAERRGGAPQRLSRRAAACAADRRRLRSRSAAAPRAAPCVPCEFPLRSGAIC